MTRKRLVKGSFPKMNLCDDVVLRICEKLLSVRERILFLSASVSMNKLKHRLAYTNKIHVYLIMKLPYFDNFEHVKMSQRYDIYPKNTKHVHFGKRANHYRRNDIFFPEKMTHLTFDDEFNSHINFTIPSTVTHLRFGRDFNQNIEHLIPSSVTHLTFGFRFDQEIGNVLPASITHLTLDGYFYKIINGDELPASIVEITIDESERWGYCRFCNIPSNVKIIKK